ncbi:MAG: ArnT family glycosyltransferase [Phycisphaerae bacterium]
MKHQTTSRARLTTDRTDARDGSTWRAVRPVLIATVLLAIAFEALAMSASRIWVTPDSSGYVTLALRIVEDFDFSHELYQLRLPGYPALLAATFALFGDASPLAIMAIQHAMVVGCAALSVLIGWMLWPSRFFAATVGLLTGVSLHLSGYANAILTEVPYAFTLTAWLFLILRHYSTDRVRWLIAASAVTGLSAVIKDVGQYTIIVCIAVALVTAWRRFPECHDDATQQPSKQRRLSSLLKNRFSRVTPASSRGKRAASLVQVGQSRQNHRQDAGTEFFEQAVSRVSPRMLAMRATLAIAPALLVMAPMMIHNYITFGRPMVNVTGSLQFYDRAACRDKLDSPTSASVATLKNTVAIARARGWIPPGSTHHDYLPTLHACERLYGHRGSMFESGHLLEIAQVMKKAGIDIMLEHPVEIVKNSILYTYRILLMPDEGYRMQPGGQFRDGRLATGATIYANNTYLSALQGKISAEKLTRYLPFSSQPRSTTRAWARWTGWYHTRIEKGDPILGLLDSPYEEFMAISALGLVMAACSRRRFGFLLLGFVVSYHAAGSAFMGGVQPRYVVPLHPILQILAAVPFAAAVLGAFYCVPGWIKARQADRLQTGAGHLSEHRAQAR